MPLPLGLAASYGTDSATAAWVDASTGRRHIRQTELLVGGWLVRMTRDGVSGADTAHKQRNLREELVAERRDNPRQPQIVGW